MQTLTTSPHQKYAAGILRKQIVPGSWNFLVVWRLAPFSTQNRECPPPAWTSSLPCAGNEVGEPVLVEIGREDVFADAAVGVNVVLRPAPWSTGAIVARHARAEADGRVGRSDVAGLHS